MNFRILVLASGTFAIGTGTFVVTDILGEVVTDLSVSVGSAGYLITVFAVVYALGSPALVVATGNVDALPCDAESPLGVVGVVRICRIFGVGGASPGTATAISIYASITGCPPNSIDW